MQAEAPCLIFAGEPAAVAFQQATELAGVHLSFEEGRGKQRISCIATAYHEFIRLGPELYIESLDVLLNAWNGEPDSMSSANLLGICRFVELYHSEYNKGRLIAKLRQVDAFTIFRLARTAGVSFPARRSTFSRSILFIMVEAAGPHCRSSFNFKYI